MIAFTNRSKFLGETIRVAHVQKPNFLTTNGKETLDFGRTIGRFLLPYEVSAFIQDFLHVKLEFIEAIGYEGNRSMYNLLETNEADLGLDEVGHYVTNTTRPRFLFGNRYTGDLNVYIHHDYLKGTNQIYGQIFGSASELFPLLIIIFFVFALYIITKFVFKAKIESFLLYNVSFFARQEDYQNIESISLGIVYLVTSIFGILFSNIFGAALCSNFSVSNRYLDLDYLTKTGYSVTIWNGISAWINEERCSEDSELSVLYRVPNLNRYFGVNEVKEIISFLNSPKSIFMKNTNIYRAREDIFENFSYVCNKLEHRLYRVRRELASSLVSPNSEYADHFNLAGIGRKIIKLYHEGGICDNQLSNYQAVAPVSVENVYIINAIMLLGSVSSIGIVIIEKSVSKVLKWIDKSCI